MLDQTFSSENKEPSRDLPTEAATWKSDATRDRTMLVVLGCSTWFSDFSEYPVPEKILE